MGDSLEKVKGPDSPWYNYIQKRRWMENGDSVSNLKSTVKKQQGNIKK